MKKQFELLLRRFAREDKGALLVELVIIIPLLLLLVFAVIEFGRFGYSETIAQKATDLAVRTAAVRPSACDGVAGQGTLPATFQPPQNPGGTPPRFGTFCRVGTGANPVCATIADQACTLDQALASNNASAVEIWNTIAPLVPRNATPANVRIAYTFDSELGFLGGPYTPIVTAEIVNLQFNTVFNLGGLGSLARGGGQASSILTNITFPSMSASMPAEDLGQGLGS